MTVSSGSEGNLTIEPGKNNDSALETEDASGNRGKPLVDKKPTWNLQNISELYGTFGDRNNEAIEPWEDKHNSSSDEEQRHLEQAADLHPAIRVNFFDKTGQSMKARKLIKKMPMGSHMSVVSNTTHTRLKGANTTKAIIMEDMLTIK